MVFPDPRLNEPETVKARVTETCDRAEQKSLERHHSNIDLRSSFRCALFVNPISAVDRDQKKCADLRGGYDCGGSHSGTIVPRICRRGVHPNHGQDMVGERNDTFVQAVGGQQQQPAAYPFLVTRVAQCGLGI